MQQGDLLKKYKTAKNMFPHFASIYEWMYKESGFEKLIDMI